MTRTVLSSAFLRRVGIMALAVVLAALILDATAFAQENPARDQYTGRSTQPPPSGATPTTLPTSEPSTAAPIIPGGTQDTQPSQPQNPIQGQDLGGQQNPDEVQPGGPGGPSQQQQNFKEPTPQEVPAGGKISAMTQATDPGAGNLPGQLYLILLVATPLALVVSIGLLKLYRRAVLRSMRARADSPATEPAPLEISTPSNQPVQTAPNLSVLDHASPITVGTAAAALYSDLLRAPWRAAIVYVVAGFCYAIVMTAAFISSAELAFLPFRFLSVFWVFAWPVVLTVNLVAAAARRAKLATASVYFLVLATLSAISIARSPALDWGQIALLWLLTNLPPTVLLWAFLNRRIRAVGPLVLTFMILAVTGSLLMLSFAANSERRLRSIADLGVALGLNANGIFIGLIVLGLAVFGPVGWLTLRWIGRRYEQKKISDQSITLDAIWLLFGVEQSIVLISAGIVWILSGLLAFVVYKVFAWAGFRLLGYQASSAQESPKLLLLRVFSLGRRSERLFDALAKHWRHAGSIRLIAGPDLATTTVEPHEFLDFLSGKLARRFIDGPETLGLRISEMDLEPDRDGRFRVNDFFCHDNAWQMTLHRLVADSEVVLMDLRGFSQENQGVVYEINELINVMSLGRVVLVIDETTDEQFLHQTIQECWDHMKPTSPNRSSTPEQLHLFRFMGSRRGAFRHLLAVLSHAAKPGTVGDGHKLAPV
jgi:hypothetical protein